MFQKTVRLWIQAMNDAGKGMLMSGEGEQTVTAILTVLMLTLMTGMRDLQEDDGSGVSVLMWTLKQQQQKNINSWAPLDMKYCNLKNNANASKANI